MIGKDLKRLAEVASVAKLDMTPEPIRLTKTGDRVVAFYRGMYAAAGVEVVTGGGSDFDAHLRAADFQALVALFGLDDEVTIDPLPASLRLSAGGRRLNIRVTDPSPFAEDGQYAALRSVTPYVSADRKTFTARSSVAVQGVADSVAVPILTGVRIIAGRSQGGGVVGIQSADGISTIYQSQMRADVTGGVLGGFVCSGRDLSAILRLFDGESVGISLVNDGKAAVFVDEGAVAQVPLMGGKWPDLSSAGKEAFVAEASIPTATIRALIAATKVYYTREGRAFSGNVLISPTEDGRITIETIEQEGGQFSETVTPLSGLVVNENGDEVVAYPLPHPYSLAVSDLEVATRVASGEVLILEFGNRLARVAHDGSEVYMLLRAL